jgi:hypothetical protein
MTHPHNGQADFREATHADPCPVCKKPDWCRIAEDGSVCCCRRVAAGGEERADKDGAIYYVHQLATGANGHAAAPPRFTLADGGGERADPDTLHRVYAALLDQLPLDAHHVDGLRARGLKGDLKAAGYRTLGRGRWTAVRALIDAGLEEHLPRVPGFFVNDGKRGPYWTVGGASGLLIPIRDVKQRIVAFQVRADFPGEGPRYSFVSSKKRGGAGPGAPVHVPLFDGDKSTVRVTEGALKADVATGLSGMLTVGLAGVNGWPRAAALLRRLGAKMARVAFDADARRNQNVAAALRQLVLGLRSEGFVVELERWREEDGKGIDDLLAGGKAAEVVTGDAVLAAVQDIAAAAGSTSPAPPTASAEGDRPDISITVEEHEVAAEAVAALALDPDVYQRSGALVRVVRDTSPAAKGIRRPFAPRIDLLPPPILRERLAAAARWYTVRHGAEGDESCPARPPVWCVQAVHARGEWEGVPHLEAVVEYPVMRPDGSLLVTPGYDPGTGLYLDARGDVPAVADRPTRDDAVRAGDELLALVDDFPFVAAADRTAWLASLLTPLGRFAFAGPAPLFLAEANVRGAGKGLLLDVNARVLTGENFTVATYCDNDEEMRKRITALALAGDRLVLFDNVAGKFGCASLDAALTATSWRDRALGLNRMVEAPLYMTWFATGNNIIPGADVARRLCPMRLETELERPEERGGFRIPDLLAHVAANRPRLLAAALTVLRAYCVAGRPAQGLSPWGSYEGWSNLIRSAVVWLKLPDPAATRIRLQEQSDTATDGMVVLLDCWAKMDPPRRGLTAAEVVEQLEDGHVSHPDWHADMRAAIEGVAGKLDSRALGNRLRSFRRRVFGGFFLDRAGTARRAVRWAVYPASAFREVPQG